MNQTWQESEKARIRRNNRWLNGIFIGIALFFVGLMMVHFWR